MEADLLKKNVVPGPWADSSAHVLAYTGLVFGVLMLFMTLGYLWGTQHVNGRALEKYRNAALVFKTSAAVFNRSSTSIVDNCRLDRGQSIWRAENGFIRGVE